MHHEKGEQRPDDVSALDVQGNDHADALAKDEAKKHCVPLNVSSPYLYHVRLAKRIQHRLATILINLPPRPRVSSSRPPEEPRPDISDLLVFPHQDHKAKELYKQLSEDARASQTMRARALAVLTELK